MAMKAESLSENQRGEFLLTDVAHQLTTGGGKPGQGYQAVLISPASASAPVSEDSTTASRELGFDISSSVRAILGAAPCSRPGSPESPSQTTYEKWHGWDDYNQEPVDGLSGTLRVQEPYRLIFSAAAPPARTSPSPETAPGSPGTAPASSSNTHESLALFDPDGFSGRTYPVRSLATAVGTSESSLERWPTSGTAWPGGFSTAVTSECRSDAAACSSSEPSLTEILEPPQSVPARYSLSGRAARGILRRAEKRGRSLPSHLSAALEAVARTTTTPKEDDS